MANVLFTAAGSCQSYSAILALRRRSNLNLFAVDARYESVGFAFVKPGNWAVVPLASERGYIDSLLEICKKKKIDILFPCTDVEAEKISMNKKRFEKCGTKPLVSPLETVKVCRDKLKSFENLHEPFTPTYDFAAEKSEEMIPYPKIVKPRKGYGTRDVHVLEDESDRRYYHEKLKEREYIVQKRLIGEEYTVDFLSDYVTHKLLRTVPRVRTEIMAGLTSKCIVTHNEVIEKTAQELTEKLRFSGLCCFQGFMTASGFEVYEINPRLGGGATMPLLRGIDLPWLAIKNALGGSFGAKELAYSNGSVFRYLGNVRGVHGRTEDEGFSF